MDTLQATLAGGPSAPYHGPLLCKGCGSHIGLYNRDGQLVGMQVHQAAVIVDERQYLGPGTSGYGMWREKRRWSCLWEKGR